MLSYEEFQCKTTQVSEENELYQGNWKSFDSLACVTMPDEIKDAG